MGGHQKFIHTRGWAGNNKGEGVIINSGHSSGGGGVIKNLGNKCRGSSTFLWE